MSGPDRDHDLREAFALEDLPGPARHEPEDVLRALVSGAVDRVFETSTSSNVVPIDAARRPRRGRLAMLQVAAAVVFAITGVAAAAWVAVRLARPEPPSSAVPIAPAVPAPVLLDRHPRTAGPARVETQAPPAAPVAAESGDALAVPAPDRVPSRPVQSAEAEDLLRTASAFRAARAWADAERAYRSVIERYPRTSAAYVATVAAATLRLEKLSDPRGALGLYRRALRRVPNGDLSEEARYGMVEAHHALGDAQQELAAIREFLARHPGSAHARRLEAREREFEQ